MGDIFLGSSRIKTIRRGGVAVTAVYRGSTLIWLPPLLGVHYGANFSTSSPTTFSAVPIGAPMSSREVYVAVQISGTSAGPPTISSVTVGGVAATLLRGANSVGNFARLAIYRAVVTTGTTGDVVVTYSGSLGTVNVAVGVCVLYVITTSNSGQDSQSRVLSAVPANANGFIIAACATSGVSPSTNPTMVSSPAGLVRQAVASAPSSTYQLSVGVFNQIPTSTNYSVTSAWDDPTSDEPISVAVSRNR